MSYDKRPLNYAEQIALLRERGLTIADDERAEQFLAEVSYYRLSAYYEPFQSEQDKFRAGATFDDISALYIFDRSLRELTDEALGVVEIYLRAKLVYVLATYGAFMHEDEVNFQSGDKFREWQKRIREEASRSREEFIFHYKEKYFEDYPKLPMWMMTEVITFGTLVKLLYALKEHIQTEICRELGFHRDAQRMLNSWINSLNIVRNICAHRARLWDREVAYKPLLPRTTKWHGVEDNKVGTILYILNEFLKGIPSAVSFRKVWQADIERALNETPHTALALRVMAFDPKHALWRD